jgi:hypothetical protein
MLVVHAWIPLTLHAFQNIGHGDAQDLAAGEVSGQEVGQVEDGKPLRMFARLRWRGMVMLISWKDCSIMPP